MHPSYQRLRRILDGLDDAHRQAHPETPEAATAESAEAAAVDALGRLLGRSRTAPPGGGHSMTTVLLDHADAEGRPAATGARPLTATDSQHAAQPRGCHAAGAGRWRFR